MHRCIRQASKYLPVGYTSHHMRSVLHCTPSTKQGSTWWRSCNTEFIHHRRYFSAHLENTDCAARTCQHLTNQCDSPPTCPQGRAHHEPAAVTGPPSERLRTLLYPPVQVTAVSNSVTSSHRTTHISQSRFCPRHAAASFTTHGAPRAGAVL